MADQNFKGMAVADLLAQLEKDIRYGCHSTHAEAGRSLAGHELQTRGQEAAQAIIDRLHEIESGPAVVGDSRVRNGLALVLYWMTSTTPRVSSVSGVLEVTQQVGLSL